MFYAKFPGYKTLNDFLSISDIDYIDVFLSGDCLRLIVNSSDVYAEYSIPVKCSSNQEDCQFRMSKKLLQFIIEDDVLEFSIVDGTVNLLIKDENESLRYSCSFLQQIVEYNVYYDKMQIVERMQFKPSFNLTNLTKVFKIASLTTGVANCSNGVVSVLMKEGPRAYYETEMPASFSLTYKAFNFLKKCSSLVMDYQDYLIASNNAFTVIVRKARLQTNEEFSILKNNKFGAQYVAEVNFSQLFRFLSKTKIQAESISISLQDEICSLEAMNVKFKIPVKLSGVKTTGVLKEIAIPTMVLNKVLMGIGSSMFKLRVTKTFIQMTAENFYVVW